MLEIHAWKIKSKSGLLMNNPEGTLPPSQEPEGGTKVEPLKKQYNDNEEARKRVVRDNSGRIVVPTCWFRAALLLAGTNRKVGKLSARVAVSGAVFPTKPQVVLLNANGKPATNKDWEIFKSPVTIGKAKVIRCWPHFPEWMVELDIEIDLDFISVDVVTELLNIAGRLQGIGDWRPDTSNKKKGGTFGRFGAELLK